MKNLLISLLLLWVCIPAYASKNTMTRNIVAVVQTHAITESDIMNRIKFLMKFTKIDDESKLTFRNLCLQALNSMIDAHLINSEAKKLSIVAQDYKITQRLSEIASKYDVPYRFLSEKLESEGIDFDALQNQIRGNILFAELVEREITENVRISEAEIDEYGAITSSNVEMELQEIVLFFNADTKDRVLKMSKNLRSDILSGKNFSTMAKEFSQGVSKESGGDIGWVNPKHLSEKIAQGITSLKEGDISEPIITTKAIYIMKIGNIRDAAHATQKDLRAKIRNIIYKRKVDLRVDKYMMNLKKKAFIKVNNEAIEALILAQ